MGTQNQNQPNITVETHFEIEQKMGDGSWQTVIETMEEANYGEPGPVQFTVKDDAEKYIRRHYSYHPENARPVRVEVKTLRVVMR